MALRIAAMLRNEADRFLPHILPIWSACCDEILVLDDGSEDETATLCRDAGAYVVDGKGGAVAWGNESAPRARLFDIAWNTSRLGDYVLILDGDMIPARDPRPLMATGADAISFVLFDLWGTEPLVYREDAFWQGHLYPRVWMFKKTVHGHVPWEWSTRGVHTGHLPLNFKAETHAFAPRDHGLLHYAYASPELREHKYAAYASVAGHLTPHELAHARSILDPNPATYSLDFQPDFSL